MTASISVSTDSVTASGPVGPVGDVDHVRLVGDGLKVKTFSCYHRFLSQARWAVDALGRVMLGLVLKFIPEDAPIIVAV